jgi:hypothetical protein
LRAVVWATFIDRDLLRRRRVPVVVAVLVLLLALAESVNAVVAPMRAPTDKDWTSAAAAVRAGFHPGDLVVAAPGWADPILRSKLGDLVPLAVAGRMDAARYGRVWEISQRGAHAAESVGATVATASKHGRLTVTLWHKPAATVTFDFVAAWPRASLSSLSPAGVEEPCAQTGDRLQCPQGGALKPELVEVDTTLRNALGIDPVERATLALDYADVPLGRELAVAAGLHNVWLRKSGDGRVRVRVLVDGSEQGVVEASSASGWTVRRFDTAARAGQTGRVRFEITVDRAHARHLGLAAEARNP